MLEFRFNMPNHNERINPVFGEIFRSMLEDSGLTQFAFAQSVGVDVTTINRFASGKGSKPRGSTLFKVVKGFGLEVTDDRVGRLYETAGLKPPRPSKELETISEDHPLSATLGRIEAKLDRLTSIIESHFQIDPLPKSAGGSAPEPLHSPHL